ncbi:hypothetical protein ACLHK8_06620 [Pediococcus sp. M21F004]|uniref:hypothetical protein n=1 Tax=Pediococcus sp. M21F004 TaxID=3390033 RepID=UPI003DA6DB8A
MNFNKLGTNIKQPKDMPDIKNLQKLGKLYQLGEAGANEIGTKLENLDAEFQVNYDHNPIHHMEERMKDVQSLAEKMRRKGYEMTIDNIEMHIFDIAGIECLNNYV